MRDHLIGHGFFDMAPCNLHDGKAEIVANGLIATLEQARAGKVKGRPLGALRKAGTDKLTGLLARLQCGKTVSIERIEGVWPLFLAMTGKNGGADGSLAPAAP